MAVITPGRWRRRMLGLLLALFGSVSVLLGLWLVVADPDQVDGGLVARVFVVVLALVGGAAQLGAAWRWLRSREGWRVASDVIAYRDWKGREQRWSPADIAVAHLYTVIVGRYPQPKVALQDRSGRRVLDVVFGSRRELDALEAALLDVGVRVTRERGSAPVAVTDRHPRGSDEVQVVSPRRSTFGALLLAAVLAPLLPLLVAAVLDASEDFVVIAVVATALVGPFVGMALVLRRTRALTLSTSAVHLGAGHRLPPGIPRGRVVALEVSARPLGSLVRVHLRGGQVLEHPLLAVAPGTVEEAASAVGLPVRGPGSVG